MKMEILHLKIYYKKSFSNVHDCSKWKKSVLRKIKEV